MSEVNIELWKQANQVYQELMELTVSDALLQLSQMTDLNDELKSLVLSLISSGDQPSQFFKQQVGESFKFEGINSIDYKPGDVIDGYELLEEIGSGGMATVFRAKKTVADSQKPVAIKVFSLKGISPLLQNRFALEQEVLSHLSHSNIVNMHHGGTSEEGVPYMVMELIEQAQDIDDCVESENPSITQILSLIHI